MRAREVTLALGAVFGTAVVALAMYAGAGVMAAFGVAMAVSCAVMLLAGPGSAPAPRGAVDLDRSEPAAPATSGTEAAPQAGASPVERPPEPAEPKSDDTAPSIGTTPVSAPVTLLSRWLEISPASCKAVSAHLWLRDGPGDTIRLLASAGPVAPARYADLGTDGVLSESLERGERVMAAVSAIESPEGSSRLWRYALPLSAGSHSGVAALDVLCDDEPDVGVLDVLSGPIAPMLAAALAVDIAREVSETSRTLLEMARDLSRILSVDDVIEACLDKAVRLTSAATGSVMLVDEDTGLLRIAAAKGLPADVVAGAGVGAGEGIAGWVLASGQPVLVEDLPTRPSRPERHGVRSSLSVPITDESGVLGVLNVGSRNYPARFGSNHMSALETLGRQTAVAIRNARAVTCTRDLYFSSIRALALALETKDPFAAGATDRIVTYTTALAASLQLSNEEVEAIRLAALLHDICMDVATDPASAKRQLSTVERGMVTMHPVLAADVLRQAPALSAVVPIVYHHHEWYDGRGYVGGLSGESIPLGARILAVADAYVAMTSDRPYRRALACDEAMRELQEKSGTQFDPAVVGVFVELIGAGQERHAEA